MSEKIHYQERIHRATQQLAQLQVRELMASQRKASRAKEKQRREETQRRQRVAELVFLAGAQAVDDSELLSALKRHMETRLKPPH